MVTEFICGIGSQTLAIIELIGLLGITIGGAFLTYGLKVTKKIGIKRSIITGIFILITLVILIFEAFVCPYI